MHYLKRAEKRGKLMQRFAEWSYTKYSYEVVANLSNPDGMTELFSKIHAPTLRPSA